MLLVVTYITAFLRCLKHVSVYVSNKRASYCSHSYSTPSLYNDIITFQNTNVTSMYVGPRNLMLADNQKLIAGPLPFVVIPPGHYCVVQNPIDHT